MRQQKPPAGTVFLLCLNCDRGEWRKLGNAECRMQNAEGGRGETGAAPSVPLGHHPSSIIHHPSCRHCNGPTEQRYPLTLALTEADRGLLKTIAEWNHIKTDVAATNAIHGEFRKAATARAAKGKPIPQWAAEWLQNNKGE